MNEEIKRNMLEKLSEKMVTALFTDGMGETSRTTTGKFMMEPVIREQGLPPTGNYIHFIDGQIYEVHLDSINGIYPYQKYQGGQIAINELLMIALQRGGQNGRT